jgi:valyl-tRNA synthetase
MAAEAVEHPEYILPGSVGGDYRREDGLPMALEKYDPTEIQDRWTRYWEEGGHFHSQPTAGKTAFSIVIPPPNVTGALHLGHALNGTIQDVLVRFRRMQGFEALWIPGADHAGIATQAVVEKRLFEEEKKTRHDIGREALVARIWAWKDEYEARIRSQLRGIGASPDWSRWRFTLDEICARAVRQTFFAMFEKGLIYRGKRLVNWDCQLQTAVADDEVYHAAVKGHLWHLLYPVEGSAEKLEVATTRPETMLGDTAVAVHPDDPRYKHLIGKRVILPLIGRAIPIIGDGQLVDPAFGTGVVKVTPAHDPNDYACGLRHRLEQINIMHPDGRINDHGGAYSGLKREQARQRVVADLEALGLLAKVEPHEHNVGHSDRSKTAIEPYLSDQWFVKMEDLAERAMSAVREGRVRIHPSRYAETYLAWLSEKRDWCISRQLWWGHQIPIWHGEGFEEEDLRRAFAGKTNVCWQRDAETGRWLICSMEDLSESAISGHTLRRDPDVLDTWFSSALWPHSTMGWPEKTAELDFYYPTSVLSTAREIITLWVARMVIMSDFNLGQIPFRDVFIHPVIQDGKGMPMKKSLGNGVDPFDIIAKYGADALRYTLTSMTTETQDVRLPVKKEKLPDGREVNTSEKFEIGRNFGTKIFNASKLILMNLDHYVPGPVDIASLQPEDQWILIRLDETARQVTAGLDSFGFAEVARLLYEFVWGDLCDWYIELIKPRLREGSSDREQTQRVAATVLDGMLRLVHPVMPFVTEEVWHALNEAAPLRGIDGKEKPAESLVRAAWTSPTVEKLAGGIPEAGAVGQRMALLQDVIRSIRNIRAEFGVDAKADVSVAVECSTDGAAFLASKKDAIVRLAKVGDWQAGASISRPAKSASNVLASCKVYVPLADFIDVPSEVAKQNKRLAEMRQRLAGIEAKLSNEKFVAGAPAEVVQQQRQTQEDLLRQIESISAIVADLNS